jgi:hypothetical protein
MKVAVIMRRAPGGDLARLVEDAGRGLAAESAAQTIQELRAAGVEFTTTNGVLKIVK